MLAVTPCLFSTTYGWPLEDLIAPNLQQQEANSYYSHSHSHSHADVHLPPYEQMKQDFSSSSGVNGTAKKLNHNASERDRRKRVNDLYVFLRSLLPISSDHKKKVSIPGTVSRALKYVPELQKEVETLIRKKKALSCSSSTAKGIKRTKSSVVSCVNALGDKEAVVQLISSTDDMSKSLLSQVLEYLEQEEDGLVLLNLTTFKCSGEGRLLNTLHLQMQGDYKIEAAKLKEKLCVFQQ